MPATPLEFHAIPSNEPPKKRKRCDDPEIYDSNGKTRRVNPYKLGERLGSDLVREMEVYIKPGAMMPNFAIRKRLQEKYQVDRRHLYDYFHSRGLRVAKEDRHSNLTRSRQAKAAAEAVEESRSASRKGAGQMASSKKPEQKKSKPKTTRAPLVQTYTNVRPSSPPRSNDYGDDTFEDRYIPGGSIYAHENRDSSPHLPQHVFLQAQIPNELTPYLSDDPDLSASQTNSTHADEPSVTEISLPTSLPDALDPLNIGDWLAERTVEDSSTADHSLDTTLVEDEAEAFSPCDFIKETLDTLNFNYEDYLTFDDDPLAVSHTEHALGDPERAVMVCVEDQMMSIPERQKFYNLVNDALKPLDVGALAITSKCPPISPASQGGLSNAQPAVGFLGASPAQSPLRRVETIRDYSPAVTAAHIRPSSSLTNSNTSLSNYNQGSFNHPQMVI
ncbi:hypothetical protein PQX77_003795 [Marasmius sp. AFHP31]|nr:hypothetical protein PQX77_003795 [Marasmius sp. AFHP31]